MDTTPLSPYRPGFGARPLVVAGREQLLRETKHAMVAMTSFNQPHFAPIVLVGPRGMGKTVSLGLIEEQAGDHGFATASLSFVASGRNNTQQLATSVAESLEDGLDAERPLMKKLAHYLAGFSIEINTGFVTVTKEFQDGDHRPMGLAETLETATAAHVENGKAGLMLLIDELHTGSPADINMLYMATQHMIQRSKHPFAIIAAGTPDTPVIIGASGSSFGERSQFLPVSSLDPDAALEALVEPARRVGVSWSPEAIELTLSAAQGNPWRIQQLGEASWRAAEEMDAPLTNGSTITSAMASRAIESVAKSLEQGSFPSRWRNASPAEREYLTAMAQVMGPDYIAQARDLNALLGKTAQDTSELRRRLINKGLIASPQRGALRFTAPGFDRYLLELHGLTRLSAADIAALHE